MRSDRKKEEKKKNSKIIFTNILAIVYIIAIAAFVISVFMVNVLPALYFTLLILVLAVISFFILRALFKKPGKTRSGREPKKASKKKNCLSGCHSNDTHKQHRNLLHGKYS